MNKTTYTLMNRIDAIVETTAKWFALLLLPSIVCIMLFAGK